MYGGDEASAIVIDLGSHACKAGLAGEDAPRSVFSSVSVFQFAAFCGQRLWGQLVKQELLGMSNLRRILNPVRIPKNGMTSSESDKTNTKRKLYVGCQALGYRRDFMEVISPFIDGVAVDWDIVDNIWDHAFREHLLIDPRERPMLLAEPSSNTPQQRERVAKLMFENYKVPALFLAKNAALTSFAAGRATSLVVDRLWQHLQLEGNF
ncbi:LOW QUALITY PROTEIN: actin-related protein 4 [Asparagus officinalis]|uniref:LOW QUALITY PROTEIN: actin-related protein 4 n=1 Tax=Asparagus officinalis TaxID=4686 RepID=UPI00098E0109|nr:LOW QUALITY PROTEIN: actin-related protein 4 [Asparagus officinalis]